MCSALLGLTFVCSMAMRLVGPGTSRSKAPPSGFSTDIRSSYANRPQFVRKFT